MNLKNLVLGIAIFILTIAAGIYGLRAIYGAGPQYEDYCHQYDLSTMEKCFDFNGTWDNNTPYNYNTKMPPMPAGDCNLNDFYVNCNKEFEKAKESYNKKIFLTTLPLGIIIVIIGAVFFSLISVGAGLMAGGVGIIIYGVIGFWNFANDFIKFFLSLFALIIIILLSYYINHLLKKSKRKK